MLPRLRAEESMEASTRVAVGTGSLSKESAESITRGWTRAAEQGSKRQPSVKATPESLRSIGIKVVRTPKPKTEAST